MDKQMIQTAIDRVVYRLLHLGGAYALYTVFGLRKAAAPVLVGTVLWVLLLTAASCLIYANRRQVSNEPCAASC